jgi:aspartyl-tRNA(Asn)/glutamyl-tRNA(Gln) amidotransferase subunit C
MKGRGGAGGAARAADDPAGGGGRVLRDDGLVDGGARPTRLRLRGCGGKAGETLADIFRQGSRPMSIDTDTAARVAKLARIRVEDDQLPALAQEFSNILDFIEQLNEVDVEGVEPMVSVTPMRLKRRQDGVTDGNQQDKILSNAPDAREGFFAVPKVVE